MFKSPPSPVDGRHVSPDGEWIRTTLVVQAVLTTAFAYLPVTADRGRWFALELAIAGVAALLALSLERLGRAGRLVATGFASFSVAVGVGGVPAGHYLPGTLAAFLVLV
nr:hypothetical protein [Actinomycetota bacterium]